MPEPARAHHEPQETVAAPNAAMRPLTLSALEAAIRAAWGKDTSDDPEEWTPAWRARGQCGVTSIVVRELLGGEILIAPVVGASQEGEHHAWNRLPTGLELDLTADQFLAGETLGPAVAREPYGHARAPRRAGLIAPSTTPRGPGENESRFAGTAFPGRRACSSTLGVLVPKVEPCASSVPGALIGQPWWWGSGEGFVPLLGDRFWGGVAEGPVLAQSDLQIGLTAAGRGPRLLAAPTARVRPAPPGGVRHPKRQQDVAPLRAGL